MSVADRPASPQPESSLLRILAEAATIEAAGERLLELTATAFGCEVGVLWLADDGERVLEWIEGWSAEDDLPLAALMAHNRRLTFAPGVGLPGRVWESGVPEWTTDVADEPDLPREAVFRDTGIHGAIAIPLTAHQGPVGVMELLAREELVPDPAQIDLALTIGRQVGLYVARVRAEQRLVASEEVGASVVGAALDCIVTMDHTGVIVGFNPAAEATFGWVREDAVGRRLGDLIVPPELREAHESAVARYVESREPTILNRRLELSALRADGSSFPIELTVTRLGRREPPLFAGFVRDITDRHRYASALGLVLARAHDARVRAERAEHDARRVAETLQRSLLPPHLADVPGVQVGAVYRAAMEGVLVGGDFYDVFALGQGRWGIAMGDVCGKGADAAALTALLRYTIRTAAVREPGPAAVLEVANQALVRHAESLSLCTAIYADLDVSGPRPSLRFAVAGHPLPLLAHDGAVAPVGREGTLLGAVPAPDLHEHEVTLDPGDVLLLYTDGVTESQTPDGFFGQERLAELLSGCVTRADAAAQIAACIGAAVVETPGHRVLDDVAVLALRAAGADQGADAG